MKNGKFKQNSKDKRQKTFFSKEICVRACAYGNNFVILRRNFAYQQKNIFLSYYETHTH